MSETSGDRASRRTLADRLNHLFAMVRPPGDAREYTGREVTAAIRGEGIDISPSHLSELRRGLKANPTLRVMQGLAGFFQVRVAYLLGDDQVAEEVEAELELREAMRDAEVRDVAARVAGLDPNRRKAMYRLLTDSVHEHGDDTRGSGGESGPGTMGPE